MKIFNVSLYNGTYVDFLQKILHVSSPTLVFTPNPEILFRAYSDTEFMDILQSATYNVPDGNGLYVAQMMQEWKGFLSAGFRVFFDKNSVYSQYGELIKGSDLTKDILESAKENPKNILIIDRKNAVARNDLEKRKMEMQKNLSEILEKKFPGTKIFVVFEWEKTDEEIAKIITDNAIGFVFSNIGMKIQEERLQKVFAHLPKDFGVVGIGVGASIDFLLWLQKRAPKIFRNSWLEWLYRLITQPKIRYKRIKTALIDFPKLVKKEIKNPQA